MIRRTTVTRSEIPRSQGFSLLEVLIGVIFAATALLGLGGAFISNQRAHETCLDQTLVTHAFRHVAETIRATPFEEAVKYHGHTFTIDELKARGRVTMFFDETDSSEDAKKLGFPRDLNGDGAATNVDVSASYTLIPIKIELEWDTIRGLETTSLYTFFSFEG